jgi:hypothetical protein
MSESLKLFTSLPSEYRIPYVDSLGIKAEEFRVFQSKITSSFEQIVSSGDHDIALERFRYAYEFRRQYPYNVESGKVINKPNGLTQALDNMMVHSGMTFYGLASEQRRAPIDDLFRQRLAVNMKEASRLNRGIVTLASEVINQKGTLTDIKPEELQESLIGSMNTYWDRTGFPEVVKFRD